MGFLHELKSPGFKNTENIEAAKSEATDAAGTALETVPATGDDTPVLLWLLLFTASVGLLLVVIKKYKNIK